MSSPCPNTIPVVMAFLLGTAVCHARVLRVCADPNNMPFSNQAGEGFENKLAMMVAHDLNARLEYTWWSERKSFVKNSLGAGKCDVILGIASTVESVLVTKPYYRSTYVFLTRKNRSLNIASLVDDRLQGLRVGVHVVGDDYAPPALVLAQQGLSANLIGFSLFGTYGEINPPAKLINAVSRGEVDVGIVWGPFAGYFSKGAEAALSMAPVMPPAWRGVPFTYAISMAVRPNEPALRDELNSALERQCPAIQALLTEYGVPTVLEDGPKCEGSQQRLSVSSR
jgi:mxaJ protein